MKQTRRMIVQLGMQFVTVCTLLPLMTSKASAAGACTDAASENLRSSLHYTDVAPDPTQTCSRCAFFSKGDANDLCGKCTIMDGPVSPKGHCDSWSMKQA
jgi:uncharacterized paraquat-inducible protein A